MSRSRKVLARGCPSLIVVSLLACSKTGLPFAPKSSVTALTRGETDAASRMVAFEPEDLALNFLDADIQRHAPLSLEELGLGDADIEAVRKGTHNLSLRGARSSHPDCIEKAANWYVTMIRFAPNAIAFPGQPGVWKAWAASRGARIDRMPEIRYVVRPFCGRFDSDGPTIAEDSALHVIFRPAAAPGIDRRTALGTGFTDLELSGRHDGADTVARAQLAVMSSNGWADYRARVVEDWNAISRAREAAGARTKSLPDLIRRVMTLPKGFRTGPFIHQDLVNPRTSAVYKAVDEFTRKYALRQNLVAVTSMLSTAGRTWHFGSFLPNGDAVLAAAKMQSFHAQPDTNGVRVTAIAEQAGGEDSPGILTPGSFIPLPGATPELIEEHEAGFSLEVVENLPRPNQFASFRAAVTDLEKVNPTTITCGGCHKLAAGFDEDGLIPGSNESFIMTEGSSLNVLTAKEILEESEQLNQEFGLKRKAPRTPNPDTAPVACKVHSADGPMNVRLVPGGRILGQVTHLTPLMKMGAEGEWVRVQVRVGGRLLGAGGSGSPTAYVHATGIRCP